jgi:hypothetical protein
MLVNREYKPLGYARYKQSHTLKAGEPAPRQQLDVDTVQDDDTHVNYMDYSASHVSLTTAQIKQISVRDEFGAMYLDHCPPWASRKNAEAYMRRLELLFLFINEKGDK